MNVRRSESWRALLDKKAQDLFVLASPHQRDVRQRSVRDPRLFAVQHKRATVTNRLSAHSGRIRSKIGFSQAEASDLPAGLQLRQPAVFLLSAAVFEDRPHHKRTLYRHETPDPAVAPLQLLHQQIHRKARFAEALPDDGQDAVIHKMPGRPADELFLLGEQTVQVDEVHASKGKHQAGTGFVELTNTPS